VSEQLEFFTFSDRPATPAPRSSRSAPPTQRRGTRGHATPDVAADVLAEVQHARYGLLDDSDRVVVFEDDDRVRLALDEDTVLNLLAQGYVERRPARDTVSCHHGAVRRPVIGLRLTRRGRDLLTRWSALHSL
jgi:hypothetical protein